jgi:hypothetical protein
VTAPLQYGSQPPPDPTAVMGRRTLAWIADLALYATVVAAGFASMAEYTDIPSGIAEADACALFEQQNPGAADGCIAYDGQLFLLDAGEAGVQTLVSIGWLAFYIVLQGLTGASPGKLLFGVRVVDQYGARCGIGKSLGRTLMWAVDAAPWLIPLVGPITAFTSSGHRRVGDLAAGTYVVSSAAVGQPVMVASTGAPAGQQPWGAPAPGWGSAPPTAPPTTPPPGSMLSGGTEDAGGARWSSPVSPPEPELDIRDLDVPAATEPADQAPPTVEADPDWSRPPDLSPPEWEAPTLPEVEDPSAGWAPPGDPGPEPAPFVAPGAEPNPPEPATATPRVELPPPQWDAARGTYLQWEPNRRAWLQWDAAAERWKPIDT